MRFHPLLSALCCACLMACGGSSSGSIDITATSTLGAAEAEQISQFVFVVSNPAQASAGSLLYPSECLTTCDQGEEDCPSSGACFSKTKCGFSADASSFDPNISFDDFAEGSTIAVRMCGLTEDGQIIGAGINQVTNSDGATMNISLSVANECGGLPAVCP